jgi:glutaredoxin-related protein
MTRPILSSENMVPGVVEFISAYHQDVVSEVAKAIAGNRIVVVGMGSNPFVKKARHALTQAGVDFKYLGYGNYWSLWKPRLAIKLWSGWPTFPQVFVDGKLIGGFKETEAALQTGLIAKK